MRRQSLEQNMESDTANKKTENTFVIQITRQNLATSLVAQASGPMRRRKVEAHNQLVSGRRIESVGSI